MALTIASGFEGLRSNLEITTLQKTTVSDRQQNVRKAVEQDMKVLDSFLTGSYPRSTMIAPLAKADVDIFMVLDPSYYAPDGQASLLDRVKRVLQKPGNYPNSQINRRGQAVTIAFSDFLIDVVPAFNRKGGGFLIPESPSKRWIATDPTVHASALGKANADHDGDLVPLAKMVKGWNRAINSVFVSFYLELIAVEILRGVKISDFPSGVRYFFDKGRERVKTKAKDPAGYGDQVNPLQGITLIDAVSRFETAYGRAKKAEDYAKQGEVREAFEEWRKVFGDYFPAYG